MTLLSKLSCCIYLLFSTSLFANIQTHREPSSVSLGNSFRLTLIIDNNPSHSEPELTPLQSDFFMQATAHSVSTSLINGQLSRREQWILTLQPQHTGTLIIPPIQIGTEYSTPTQITVTKAIAAPAPSTATSNQEQNAQLIGSTSAQSAYINQEIRYTVKLMHRDPLLDSEYQPPQLNEGFVIPLGQGKHYQMTMHNELVNVEEQEYALFPQKNGKQILQGPQLHGALLQYGMPQPLDLRARPTTLHVKPIPQGSSRKTWLPARAVSLTEHYDLPKTRLTEGSTIRRTIKLTALGEPAELLPSITAKTPEGVSVYPEKPELNNRLNGQELVGEKIVVVSYLLNQPGQVTLPAYSITWFDTADQTSKIVTLPARPVHVTAMNKSIPHRDIESPSIATAPTPNNHLAWIIAGVFAVLWLLTLSYSYWRKLISCLKFPRRQPKQPRLAEELLSNDPRRAEQAVLQWARHTWPRTTIQYLDELIHLIDDASIREELSNLQAQRYGHPTQNNWQGKMLWDKLKHYQPARIRTRKASRTELPPINP